MLSDFFPGLKGEGPVLRRFCGEYFCFLLQGKPLFPYPNYYRLCIFVPVHVWRIITIQQ